MISMVFHRGTLTSSGSSEVVFDVVFHKLSSNEVSNFAVLVAMVSVNFQRVS